MRGYENLTLPSGEQLWVARMEGTEHFYDRGHGSASVNRFFFVVATDRSQAAQKVSKTVEAEVKKYQRLSGTQFTLGPVDPNLLVVARSLGPKEGPLGCEAALIELALPEDRQRYALVARLVRRDSSGGSSSSSGITWR